MISIVFDGPPGPEAGRFVEVERDGKSIRFGEWEQDGKYWKLNLVEVARLEEQLAETEQRMRSMRPLRLSDIEIDSLREQLTEMREWINANPQRKRAYELDSRSENE